MVAVEAGGAMYDIGTSADKSTVIASTKTRPQKWVLAYHYVNKPTEQQPFNYYR